MREFLGLDTSNYTTSCALLDTEIGQVRQAKKLLPVKAGMAGLRQSDAVFHHTRQLPDVLQMLLPDPPQNLSGIGVTVRPRNVEGSYMPCFLCGKTAAHMIGISAGLPIYETSHQVGHVLAALYSSQMLSLLQTRFLAFHVSGGTTDCLLCEPDDMLCLKIIDFESRTGDRSGWTYVTAILSLWCRIGAFGIQQYEAVSYEASYSRWKLLSVWIRKSLSVYDTARYCIGRCGTLLFDECERYDF